MKSHDNTSSKKPNFINNLINDDIESGRFDSRVQTRFPPEPNGYLHVGHAKAICVNFNISRDYSGIFNLRYDDTNPMTENTEFVEGILEDLEWLLGESLERKPLHTSAYFDQLYTWAEKLISDGKAYVDNQDGDTISEQRGGFQKPGINSPYRDRSIEENLNLFREMRSGKFSDGECVLRAKISMDHDNMNMRDPIMYRIRHENHYRTGDEWCIYPTYDWAHGQSDAIEKVTHSLCSLEFDSHRELYDWFLDQLEITGSDRPYQTEFARLNFTHTVLSKRLLKHLVEQKVVDGWDDPRMPTLRGFRKRGYPATAIRSFCEHIGVARTNGTHEIELLESFVRNDLNKTADRKMAVLKPLLVTITNWPEGHVETRTAINNPEDESAGTREVPFSGSLFIERDDFMENPEPKYYRLSPGREVRLRYGYFITCNDVIKDDQGNPIEILCTYDPETSGGKAPDGRKVKATIHWVSAEHAIEGSVALYERLFTAEHPGEETGDALDDVNLDSKTLLEGAKLEPSISDLPPGAVVQFERLGYFHLDEETPAFFHRTVGLRDEWANIVKRRKSS
ncbi:MAG: glutamine--tRNA ligase [Acidimicrobiaceae bacterium]|jgi:glutaminyl-tRNA synthetase|nr:glutamine--tRNA ligase [Acidimicrobiaceae bacterium]HAY50983.1 glutamine--tRNA ligase [Acidimicrobiaceae bacterium]